MRACRFRSCAITLFVALSASCGGASDTGGTSADLVVSIGIAEPKFLIPSSATESAGAEVLHAIFTALVDYDQNFRPHEIAAESITSTDNKTWTIKLKSGWTFHNGEPVTADSYINAWNAGAWGPNAHDGNYFFDKIEGFPDLNPVDGRSAPRAKKLTGLVKKDDLTFDVVLREPYVNFKSMLGYTVFYPLPVAAFSNVAENQISPTYQEAPIGQGPYKMKGAWQHDQLIELERYDNYQGPDKAVVAGLAYRIYQTLPTQYQDLLAGQLDVVPRIPVEAMASVRSDLGDRFKQSPASTIQILAFPTFDKRFSDVRIRRAISMAIDRDEITKAIFLDSQKPLRSFVSPVVPGFRENSCGEACIFNPQKAKALFDAAGGARAVGGRLQITYNNDGGHKPWVDATCNQITKHLGVPCVGNSEARFADMLTKAERRIPIGLFRMGWVMDYPAMENYLGPLYTTRGSSNYYGYSNPEFDKLVAAGDRAATVEESTKLYQQAEDLLARDLPVLPLRTTPSTFGYSTRLKSAAMDVFDRVDLSSLVPNTP